MVSVLECYVTYRLVEIEGLRIALKDDRGDGEDDNDGANDDEHAVD